MKNKSSDFLLYEEEFYVSPIGKASKDFQVSGAETIDLVNGVQKGGFGIQDPSIALNEGEKIKIYIDAPKTLNTLDTSFDIMVYPKLGDYKEYFEDIWEDEEGNIYKETGSFYRNTLGLPVFISKEGIEYVNKGHDAYGNYAFQIPEIKGDILEYPGHAAFSYTAKEKTGIYGNSCPMNAVMAQNSFNNYVNDKMSSLSVCYIGRFG